MHIISMKQLREHFEPIREGLERGESYLLMYRSKPLGTLLPYEQDGHTRQVLSQKTTATYIPTPTSNPISTPATAIPSQHTPHTTVTIENLSATKPITQTAPLRKFGLKQILNPK